MVIDDQWGRPDHPFIRERYGALPFRWVLESAESGPNVFSARRALERVRQERPAVILLDLMFGEEQSRLGLEILEDIRAEFPSLPVIVFSSLESKRERDLVARCMEIGANEFLEKAPTPVRLEAVLGAYLAPDSGRMLYGNSPSIRRLRAEIARASFNGKASVFIVGESGTGKELVAAMLHRLGPRRDRPFVALNCAFHDSELLESELFGHKKGAFTGASESRPGLLAEAHGGVLFLDEVSSMPAELQGRLLRALETRSFRPLGGGRTVSSDFQLVCAANEPIERLLDDKRLRADFYYRIASVTLEVPPLRHRREDIIPLAEMFLARYRSDEHYAGYRGARFSPAALRRLQDHSWPGNVRELRNAVERSLILSRSPELEPAITPASVSGQATTPSVTAALTDDPRDWPLMRLRAELALAIEAQRRIRARKGGQWRAEFMRTMYPHAKAANAKGVADLVRRLTTGPWGSPDLRRDPVAGPLLAELEHG